MSSHLNSSRSLSANKRRAIAEMLAEKILAAMDGQKLAASFIEGYAKQYGRSELVVHADRNRELQSIFEREILLAILARIGTGASAFALGNPEQFLSSVLDAIATQRRWTAGDRVEVGGELNLYREIIAKNAVASTRPAKPGGYVSKFQGASAAGPFVDRCAFVLDPSMMENARIASAKFLREIESLTDKMLDESFSAARSTR